jgi:hypothetical protein
VVGLEIAPVDDGVGEAEVGGALQELVVGVLGFELPRAVIREPEEKIL